MKRFFPVLLLLACVLETSCYEDELRVDYDYINGQPMTFVPTWRGKADYVEYFWDDVLIDTIKEMPFVLVYPIQGQTSGDHKLSYTIHTSVSSGNYSRSSSYKYSKTIKIK